MPESKEMKMQWITVDGRQVPLILPQIWDADKEEWVVTSTENPLPTQLTGSNVDDKNPLPVKEMGRAVEIIRNYSMTVDKPGNHSAGDVFERGNSIPALNISNYRNVMITIFNEGTGDICKTATLRIFSSRGNNSGGSNASPYTIFIKEIPNISEGGKMILTGNITMDDVPGFLYVPQLNLPIVEMTLTQVMTNEGNGATIQIVGESRQKSEGDK